MIIFGLSSYINNFSIIDLLAPSISLLKKNVYMKLDQNNPLISDQISKFQVLLNQIFHNIKIHAISAKKCFLVDMKSDHFSVHLSVDLYMICYGGLNVNCLVIFAQFLCKARYNNKNESLCRLWR